MARWASLDASETADLRRRRNREIADQLIERASLLLTADRLLVEAVYRDGNSVTEVARLSGEEPRSMRRRLRRLIERMLNPAFMVVARRRQMWSASRRRVATAVVLHGLTLRETAARLGMTFHSVRRHHEAVQALIDDAYREIEGPASEGLSVGRLRS